MPGGDFEYDERVEGRKRPPQCQHIKIISTSYKISSIHGLFIEYKYRKGIVCDPSVSWRVGNVRFDVPFRVGRLGPLSAGRGHGVRSRRCPLQGSTRGVQLRKPARLPAAGGG